MTIGYPTGDDVILVGTHRPTVEKVLIENPNCNKIGAHCPVGHRVSIAGGSLNPYVENGPADCTRRGCYDKPVYVSLQELIAAGWQPKVPE